MKREQILFKSLGNASKKVKEIKSHKEEFLGKVEKIQKISTNKRYKKERMNAEIEELKDMVQALFQKNINLESQSGREKSEVGTLKKKISELSKKLLEKEKHHEENIKKISEIISPENTGEFIAGGEKTLSQKYDSEKIKELKKLRDELKKIMPGHPKLKIIEEKIRLHEKRKVK